MQVGYISSSSSEKCLVCGKRTSTFKAYHQSGMEIRVPLCDSDFRTSCYSTFDIKKMATKFLIDVKKECKRNVFESTESPSVAAAETGIGGSYE